jgi:Ca-activated chloride channel homolog
MAQFSGQISLVEVYATVTDGRGQAVRGLTADDFEVVEDGVPQVISAFAAGDVPLSLAVGIDRSFSIRPADLRQAARAVETLLRSLHPFDQSMLIAIGSQTEIVAPLSKEREAAFEALSRLEPFGTTPLFDATLAALAAIQPAAGRRALILVSDGQDRYSDTSATVLLKTVREGDVLVYPVELGRGRAAVFSQLAAASGGRSFQVVESQQVQGVLTTIAGELRAQYLVGYVPNVDPAARPGWRSIRVTVARPGVSVRAREGYVAR